jgi:hypothetical protein
MNDDFEANARPIHPLSGPATITAIDGRDRPSKRDIQGSPVRGDSPISVDPHRVDRQPKSEPGEGLSTQVQRFPWQRQHINSTRR